MREIGADAAANRAGAQNRYLFGHALSCVFGIDRPGPPLTRGRRSLIIFNCASKQPQRRAKDLSECAVSNNIAASSSEEYTMLFTRGPRSMRAASRPCCPQSSSAATKALRWMHCHAYARSRRAREENRKPAGADWTARYVNPHAGPPAKAAS
jgi:hypothetical protein